MNKFQFALTSFMCVVSALFSNDNQKTSFPCENVKVIKLNNGIELLLESKPFDEHTSIRLVIQRERMQQPRSLGDLSTELVMTEEKSRSSSSIIDSLHHLFHTKQAIFALDVPSDNFDAIESFICGFSDVLYKRELISNLPKESYWLDEQGNKYPLSTDVLLAMGEYLNPLSLSLIAVGNFDRDHLINGIKCTFKEELNWNRSGNNNSQRHLITFNPKQHIDSSLITLSFSPLNHTILNEEQLENYWELKLIERVLKSRLNSSFSTEKCSLFSCPSCSLTFTSKEPISDLQNALVQIESIKNTEISIDELNGHLQQIRIELEQSNSTSFIADYLAYQSNLSEWIPSYAEVRAKSRQLFESVNAYKLYLRAKNYLKDNFRWIAITSSSFIDEQNFSDLDNLLSYFSHKPNYYRAPTHTKTAGIVSWPSKKQRCIVNYHEEEIELPMGIEPVRRSGAAIEPYKRLPINNEEKKLISDIVNTLASYNVVELLFKKGELQSKGEKIQHVHPMRFMGYVFSDPKLSSNMQKISSSYFKWSGFVDGFAQRIEQEHQRNNLSKHVPGFIKEIHVDTDQVNYYIQKREWEELLLYLIKSTNS